MAKKPISNKTINLLEYYSTLNFTNFFSNVQTKSNQKFLNKQQLIIELFNEINGELGLKRNNNFFFKGNPNSSIMVLGDFPDEDDIKNQEIFSESKGELLTKMLTSISLDKENYYLSNIYFDKEININSKSEFYKNILLKQIKIIKPKYILLLGEVASNYFNNSNKKISELHGKWGMFVIDKYKFSIFTTFNPNHLLKEPEHKKLAWQDLKIFKNQIFMIQ
jgi:DNA polymerase